MFILQRGNGSLDVSQDLDSSFTVDILGRAGLSQFINTPKRRLQEMAASKETLYLTPMRSISEQVQHLVSRNQDSATEPSNYRLDFEG